MYYPCSENKGAGQLRGFREADLRLCFRIFKKPVFSQRGSLVKWPPAACFLYIVSICKFSHFPFWCRDKDSGSDCTSSWSLLTFYFQSVVLSSAQYNGKMEFGIYMVFVDYRSV